MATSPSRRGAFNSLLSTTVTPIHTSTSRLLQVVLHSFQFDEIFFQYIVRFLFDLGFRHKGSSCIPPWRLTLAFNFLHSTMVTPIHTSIRMLQVVLHSFQFDKIFFQSIVCLLFVFCLISGSGTKARLACLPLIICSALRLHQSTLVPAGCCK